jgi:hypothetical protein
MDATLDTWITAIATAIATVIAIISLLVSSFQEYIRRKEAKKALLVPSIIENRLTTPYFLIIQNYGKGVARNVRVTIDGKKLSETLANCSGAETIQYIAPGAQYVYIYHGTKGDDKDRNVTIIWDDDSKKDNSLTTTLPFLW